MKSLIFALALLLMPFYLQAEECTTELASVGRLLSANDHVTDEQITEVYSELLEPADVITLNGIREILETGDFVLKQIAIPIHDGELKKGFATVFKQIGRFRDEEEHLSLLHSAIKKLLGIKEPHMQRRREIRNLRSEIHFSTSLHKKFVYPVYSAGFSPDGRKLIVGRQNDSNDMAIHEVYTLTSANRDGKYMPEVNPPLKPRTVHVLKDSGHWLISDEIVIQRHYLQHGQNWLTPMDYEPVEHAVLSTRATENHDVKVSPDGKFFSVIGTYVDKKVQAQLFDIDSKDPVRDFWNVAGPPS